MTPVSTVAVHSQIGGILQTVHFKEGQEVKKGDLLFTIDPRPLQAALEAVKAALARDQAQLANAKIQFDREQKLLDQKLVSQDEFDTSKAGYARARRHGRGGSGGGDERATESGVH